LTVGSAVSIFETKQEGEGGRERFWPRLYSKPRREMNQTQETKLGDKMGNLRQLCRLTRSGKIKGRQRIASSLDGQITIHLIMYSRLSSAKHVCRASAQICETGVIQNMHHAQLSAFAAGSATVISANHRNCSRRQKIMRGSTILLRRWIRESENHKYTKGAREANDVYPWFGESIKYLTLSILRSPIEGWQACSDRWRV